MARRKAKPASARFRVGDLVFCRLYKCVIDAVYRITEVVVRGNDICYTIARAGDGNRDHEQYVGRLINEEWLVLATSEEIQRLREEWHAEFERRVQICELRGDK